jgi:hypothetical protein
MHAKTDQCVDVAVERTITVQMQPSMGPAESSPAMQRRWFADARFAKRKSQLCACTGNCTLGCPSKRRCSRTSQAANSYKSPNNGVVFHYKGDRAIWLCDACSCDRMGCSLPARVALNVDVSHGAIAGFCAHHNRILIQHVGAREGA